MKKKIGALWTLCLLLFTPTLLKAENENPDSTRLRADDPVVAMIDSLTALKFLESNRFSLTRQNKYNFPADSVPVYSEAIYRQRIKKLDSKTPMEFIYNDKVQAYIDVYAYRYRKYAQLLMGMTEIYFPLFEQMLDKHEVPHELKYLPIVESALNPKAKSRAGAMGLWQFMLPTGRMFGLEVNSVIDERCDPIKSTEAACKYLKYLHGLYGDWNMALAAYNAGPGTVNNAIRRSGGKRTYWEIYNYLPKETQGYVPAFIAVNYVMNYGPEHNLYPSEPRIRYFEYDTVVVNRELDMSSVAELIQIPLEELKFLNPVYKTNIIPRIEGRKQYIFLPKDKVGDFLVNEDTIYKHKARPDAEMLAGGGNNAGQKTHYVKQGEFLSSIATKYNVSVADLKRWNNLKSNYLAAGQRLIIKSGENNTPAQVATTAPKTEAAAGTPAKTASVYIVRSGDTLWDIARRHGVSVDAIKNHNSLRSNGVQAGQKLNIPVKGNG